MIDNRLIKHKNESVNYNVTEVAPQIIEGHTFVPLRFVSSAFDIGVDWESSNKTVYINSNQSGTFNPAFDLEISTVEKGETIKGEKQLRINFEEKTPENTARVKFLLLDPETGKGPIIARGSSINDTYTWLPDSAYEGSQILRRGSS